LENFVIIFKKAGGESMKKLHLPTGLKWFWILLVLFFFAESVFNPAGAGPPQRSQKKKERIMLAAKIDSMEVYQVWAEDSATAKAEVARVENILAELRKHAGEPGRIRLKEYAGAGVILLDTMEVLTVKMENRVFPELSPLANALALREQVLAVTPPPPEEGVRVEEDLLLRLLLGVVYPILLLVILRMTRLGLRNWERDWRKVALQWMNRFAERRGLAESEVQAQRIINLLSGIERLAIYGIIFILFSLAWFALFPQTQPLANHLINVIIQPALNLIGGTAQAVLLILYTLTMVLFTYWLTRRLSRRRSRQTLPGILADPLVYFPLRIGLWILTLFLILFPYPGMPRLFAMGVLLLTLLAALIALRPLIEEIASGIYFNSIYPLRAGDRLTVDGVLYEVRSPGLIHLRALQEKEEHWLPYSKILKANLTMPVESRKLP
jgi:hypothetical protein